MTRFPVSVSLLLVLLLWHSLPVSAEWYESDESGVTRTAIAEGDRERHDYVVRVQRSGGIEVQTLYHLDEPVRRTELEHTDGRLVSRRIYRGEELAATEHLRYWADGSLRLMRRIGERGTTVEYRYRDGRLVEEWVDTGTSRERLRYDSVGRLEERTRWDGEELVERETREYWGPLAGDMIRRAIIASSDRETTYRYDESGRLLGSTASLDGALESDRTRRYEEGLLVEERETRGVVERVRRYEHDDEGILVRERISENGVLVRVVSHGSGEVGDGEGALLEYTRVETLYRDGAETLRVYYRAEQRLLEQIVRDGEVVRTRRFGADGGEG